MPKVVIHAEKMRDAAVTYISLVTAGANRSPFKIVKEEKNPMKLDLANPLSFLARKTGAAKPSIVAIATVKAALASISKGLTDAGFKVDKAIEAENDAVVLSQVEKLEGEGTAIRVNGDVALIVKGFEPHVMDVMIDGKPFAEVAKANQFVPGLGGVMQFLSGEVVKAAQTAKTSDEAVALIDKMFGEVQKYAKHLVSSLPQSAFKAEGVVAGEKKDPAMMEDHMTDEEKAKQKVKEEADKAAADAKAAADKEAADKEAADKAAADAAAAKAAEDAKAAAAKAENGGNSLTEAAIAGIVAKALEPVTTALTALKTQVSGVETKVGEVEATAKSAAEGVQKMGGKLIGGGDADDLNPNKKTVKYDDGSCGGREIDTAYSGGRVRIGKRNSGVAQSQ